MVIKKSEGLTPTEKLLADLCENTFLKLWSYPNPFNENRDELCDLLAVSKRHCQVFSVKSHQGFILKGFHSFNYAAIL